jgi:hypothetical protein
MTMGEPQDAKSKMDKLQAKLDRREAERKRKLDFEATQYNKTCEAARKQQLANEKKIKEDLDPTIADLKKQLRDAKRDAVPAQMRPDRKFGLRGFEP